MAISLSNNSVSFFLLSSRTLFLSVSNLFLFSNEALGGSKSLEISSNSVSLHLLDILLLFVTDEADPEDADGEIFEAGLPVNKEL